MANKTIYQLKITLEDIEPPIWRRIQVPGDMTLLNLHFVFQIAMGWTNSHLHVFKIGDERYGTPFEDDWSEVEIKREGKYRLADVIPERGVSFQYLYDFGDSWEHRVEVEEILSPSKSRVYPRCLSGVRACPPEDVGSSRGYEKFVEVMSDPGHPEHEEYRTWIGGAFDPEAFDLEQRDRDLQNYLLSDMMRIHERFHSKRSGPALKLYEGVARWIEDLGPEEKELLAELPLRRDAVSLITYLRDHEIKGTQSTGNLTLKAVRDVAALFVNPPVLDKKIGDTVYKLRTEFDVWPLYFIHALVEVGGLIKGGKGKKIRLTRKGKSFLAEEPAVQVWFLLETWWFYTNWLIAYSFALMEDVLTYDFIYLNLHALLSQPVGQPIPFEEFADRVLKRSGIIWRYEHLPHAHKSLRTGIEQMVIVILEKFQVVETEWEKVPLGKTHYRDLKAFTITPLGRGLLEALSGYRF